MWKTRVTVSFKDFFPHRNNGGIQCILPNAKNPDEQNPYRQHKLIRNVRQKTHTFIRSAATFDMLLRREIK